jgi:hypothetical protein
VQRSNAGVSAPRKNQAGSASHANHLVVDDIRRHANQRKVFAPLTDHLMTGREWNEVGKPLHR